MADYPRLHLLETLGDDTGLKEEVHSVPKKRLLPRQLCKKVLLRGRASFNKNKYGLT